MSEDKIEEMRSRLEKEILDLGKRIDEDLKGRTGTEEILDIEARLERMKYDCMDKRDAYRKIIKTIGEINLVLVEYRLAPARYKFYNDFIARANLVLASSKDPKEYTKLEEMYKNKDEEIEKIASKMSDDEVRRIFEKALKSTPPSNTPSVS